MIADIIIGGKAERRDNLRIEAVSELDASKRSYKMSITYKNNKDSPCDQLSALFTAVGWSDETKPEPFLFFAFILFNERS